MKNNAIPVVFTPDEKFIVPTCVAILSMLRKKKMETIYKFYIVVSEKIDRESLDYFARIKKIESEFDYQIVYINTDLFDTKKLPQKHISSSALYRLVLADVLSEYDKCMYHDGDILVIDDLQDMFNVDLDGYYVAGVKAAAVQQKTEWSEKYKKEWGFISLDNFISSGDLIMNLSRMRENGFINDIIRQLNERSYIDDQTLLNLNCYNQIYFLPLKYCMLNRYFTSDALIRYKQQVYTQLEILEAQQTPAVVHFAGANAKPWSNLRTVYGDIWWKYAKEFLNEQEYYEWYNRAKISTNRRDWSYVRENIYGYKSFVIFGYSQISKELFTVLNKWGCKVNCFIDNDITKQGQIYNECVVLAPVNDFIFDKDILIINAVQSAPKQVRKQLIEMGIDEVRIFDYDAKNEFYYLSVAPEFYEYEMRDIMIKNFGWETTNNTFKS